MQTAISLLNEFVDGNDVLAYTRNQNQANDANTRPPKAVFAPTMELACLVNNRSASASEIVSGAIQDLDRGVVLGSRTYGKGLVQETFQLTDGSQIRLTVSQVLHPFRTIHTKTV